MMLLSSGVHRGKLGRTPVVRGDMLSASMLSPTHALVAARIVVDESVHMPAFV